jgi:hypothetical protein
VQSYRQAGLRYDLAEEMWLRGRANLALGEVETTEELLLKAKTLAEEKGERLYLWQILATLGGLEESGGDEAEAAKRLKQVFEIIQYLADRGIDKEDLRASFLAQPAVVRVLTRSNTRISD